jgi:hypothetical protein
MRAYNRSEIKVAETKQMEQNLTYFIEGNKFKELDYITTDVANTIQNNFFNTTQTDLSDTDHLMPSTNQNDDFSQFLNPDLRNKTYCSISYDFFCFIDTIKKYYWDEMNTEDFWSENWKNIHLILNDQSVLTAEKEIWCWLTKYVSYYLKDSYPGNILDEELIKNITPKFIKSIIYYEDWIETLWEKLREYNEWDSFEDWENITLELDHIYESVYLDTKFKDFIANYNIKNNHLSSLSLLNIQTVYEKFCLESKAVWVSGLTIQTMTEGDIPGFTNNNPFERDSLESHIMQSFQSAVLDKILIAALRHKKTDYDNHSFWGDDWEEDAFSWYTRRSARRYYNQYCRAKYLYNNIDVKKGNTWETIEYIPVWIDEFDVYWDFWYNITTDEFGFCSYDEESEDTEDVSSN